MCGDLPSRKIVIGYTQHVLHAIILIILQIIGYLQPQIANLITKMKPKIPTLNDYTM
jgi:hypothetical protein